MHFGEEFKCNQCLGLFSHKNVPLKMFSCQHNICKKCLEEVKGSNLDVIQCQFCGKTITECHRKNLQTNHLLLRKIKTFGKKYENNTDTSSSIASSLKLNSNFPSFEDGEMLLAEDDFPIKRKKRYLKYNSSSNSLIGKETDLCTIHRKSLDIICLTDLKRICSHCAIFGQHKSHKLKPFQEFNEEYEQKIKNLQIIKEKKYKFDKKNKLEGNSEVRKKLSDKKQEVGKSIKKYFQELVKRLQKYERKLQDDLEMAFQATHQQILQIQSKSEKVDHEFASWESECQNLLTKLCEDIPLNEKITIMYSNSLKIQKGDKILTNVEKKVHQLNQNIQQKISSLKCEFKPLNIQSLVHINCVKREKMRASTMIQINEDFSDNSFICQYASPDVSIFLEDQKVRTPQKKVKKLSEEKRGGGTKINNRLGRCKSNEIKFGDIPTQKKKNKKREADGEEICEEFMKKDRKDALDLTNCDLNDEKVEILLKNVRKNKKIKGLKLTKNKITDVGFFNIIDCLGSTSNLNLSNNQLTEQTLGMIVKNKDKFSPLRILNISSNKVNERKAKTLVEALKKIGIIVTL